MIVKLRASKSGVQEWGLIELQGSIVDKVDGQLKDKVVGDLHFTKSHEPVLVIGHNTLAGRIVQLSQPFAVIRRVKNGDDTQVEVTAVIKQKLQFRVRPKPIILQDVK